jgi:phage terminase small subunit
MTARKPRALRLLEGGKRGEGTDSGGRPIAPTPPFRRGVGEAPASVRADPVALDEWDRIVGSMERLDLLKHEDRASVAAYCLAWADYAHAVDLYREERSPRAWKIRTDADRALHRWVRELGFSPSAESIWERQPADEPDDDNPFG